MHYIVGDSLISKTGSKTNLFANKGGCFFLNSWTSVVNNWIANTIFQYSGSR